MKKKLVLISLLLLGMVACNRGGEPTDEPGEDSSIPTISEQVSQLTKENVVDILKNLAHQQYKMNYKTSSGLDVYRIYTSKYVYLSNANAGYVEIESYDTSLGQTILYEYTIKNTNDVMLGTPFTMQDTNGKVSVVNSMNNVNYLTLLDDKDLTADDFTLESNQTLKTTNAKLVEIFASALGYATIAKQDGVFKSITLSMDNNNLKVVAEVFPEYASEATEDELTMTISEIGSAKVDAVESFVKQNSKISSKTLTEEVGSKLFANRINIEASLTYTETSTIDFLKQKVILNDTGIYTESTSSSDTSTYKIGKATQEDATANSSLNVGDAYSEFVDGTNQIVKYPMGASFSEYNFPKTYKEDLLKAMRETSEGTYHYYGFNADGYVESLLQLIPDQGESKVASLTLNITPEETSLKVIYKDQGKEGQNGETIVYHYEANIVFKEPTTVPQRTPYGKIEGVTDIVEQAFQTLTNGETAYHAIGYDVSEKAAMPSSYDYNEVYVTDKTVLIRKQFLSVLFLGSGWTIKNGKVIPFVLSFDSTGKVNGIISRQAPEENDALKSHIPWNASPNVYTLNEEKNAIILRPDVISPHRNIYVGLYAASMRTSTLKMDLNEQKQITTISYSLDNVTQASSKEQVDFTYENVQIPADIQKLIDEELKEFVTPTSWKDENPNIYKRLLDFFKNEETIKEIPYYYDEACHGLLEAYSVGPYKQEIAIHIRVSMLSAPSSFTSNATFVKGYENLLIELGYQCTSQRGTYDGKVYENNKFIIEITSTDVNGIYIYKK